VGQIKLPKWPSELAKRTSDMKGRRIIFRIGSQRLAIDWFSRITNLPPHTGDQPAAVLPIRGSGGRKKKQV